MQTIHEATRNRAKQPLLFVSFRADSWIVPSISFDCILVLELSGLVKKMVLVRRNFERCWLRPWPYAES